MGNSPSTGHGSEETHVANMEVRKTGERPTEEQSKSDIKTKSDSNEDPNQKPPHSQRVNSIATAEKQLFRYAFCYRHNIQ